MSDPDLEQAQREWAHWIERACASVGVDPALVDVAEVHGLTREIAHGFSRPMAPVGAFILGLALGQGGADANRAELLAALEDTIWTVKPADHER